MSPANQKRMSSMKEIEETINRLYGIRSGQIYVRELGVNLDMGPFSRIMYIGNQGTLDDLYLRFSERTGSLKTVSLVFPSLQEMKRWGGEKKMNTYFISYMVTGREEFINKFIKCCGTMHYSNQYSNPVILKRYKEDIIFRGLIDSGKVTMNTLKNYLFYDSGIVIPAGNDVMFPNHGYLNNVYWTVVNKSYPDLEFIDSNGGAYYYLYKYGLWKVANMKKMSMYLPVKYKRMIERLGLESLLGLWTKGLRERSFCDVLVLVVK